MGKSLGKSIYICFYNIRVGSVLCAKIKLHLLNFRLQPKFIMYSVIDNLQTN